MKIGAWASVLRSQRAINQLGSIVQVKRAGRWITGKITWITPAERHIDTLDGTQRVTARHSEIFKGTLRLYEPSRVLYEAHCEGEINDVETAVKERPGID